MAEEDMLYIGLGFLSSFLLVSYVPTFATLKSAGGCSSCGGKQSLRLENLSGIDTNALAIARQKGF